MDAPYIMGYSEAYLRVLASQSVAEACGYLALHLKPGIRVLDVGCGPGSLSVGLAEAVSPGELRGVDVEPGQVEMAARAAAERWLGNAEFSVADVRDLPFGDGSFDLVHCSDTLAYVPDTGAALEEMKRVLRPGGVLGLREIIMDGFLIHPDPGPLSAGYGVFADVLEADDGHPQMGKELALHLDRAGFAGIRVSASFEVFATPERLELMFDLGEQWFFTDSLRVPAEQYGAGGAGALEEMRRARDQWYHSPAPMAAFAFGEALAFRP